jgi:ATP-dependent DNA helicase RecQ
MTNLASILKTTFGFEGFRGVQEQVVGRVMAGRHTLAVMPTGAGKSLCYQLPALAREGTALVISPLIALMHDQMIATPLSSVCERASSTSSMSRRNGQRPRASAA